ncbi:unnamed protein product [Rangifer tarandus platyrhynchus]|uniref:Uncharacterized protein n=1 Tax=Rangifer tarandus platyrhynchus TaxID=3082113 RepID=A0ABN8ZM14_RANTA|nr:unnamed protein product [Rangifer tarandus platyrhynchus]
MFLRITYFSEEESKSYPPDFPGPVDKNLPVHIGDRGSIPGLGRSHPLRDHGVCVLQQLSPCASQPVLHRKEVTTMRSACTAAKSSPHPPRPEKVLQQQPRLSTAKKVIPTHI